MSLLSCAKTAFSRLPFANWRLTNFTTSLKKPNLQNCANKEGSCAEMAEFWSCTCLVIKDPQPQHVLYIFPIPHCSAQGGVVVSGRCLPSPPPWLTCKFRVHHNCNHLLFFALACIYFFTGSQGKPNTQIPQPGSEAQWSATDYAKVSQLLRQIPVLMSIHMITGGSIPLQSLGRREGAVVFPWLLSLNSYVWFSCCTE